MTRHTRKVPETANPIVKRVKDAALRALLECDVSQAEPLMARLGSDRLRSRKATP